MYVLLCWYAKMIIVVIISIILSIEVLHNSPLNRQIEQEKITKKCRDLTRN